MEDRNDRPGPFAVHYEQNSVLAQAVEAMQARAYHDAPWLRADLDPKIVEAKTREIARRYEAHGFDIKGAASQALMPNDVRAPGLSPPTRLQDPIAYAGIRELWLRAAELVARRGETLVQTPLLATLPTGSINARAVRASGSGELGIVFDDELRSLAYLISKIVASVIASAGSRDEEFVDIDLNRVLDPAARDGGATARFCALLDSYLRTGWIRTLPPWTLPPHQHQLALLLCAAFEHFVIGHELGHLQRRHLEGAVTVGFEPYANVSELKKRRLHEIEADAFGLMIACDDAHVALGGPLPGFWGAYLALKSFELIDRTVFVAAKRTDWCDYLDDFTAWSDESFEHPPSTLRPAMLVHMIKDPAFQGEATKFAASINALFDALFESALPVLLSGYDRGVSTRFQAQVSYFAIYAPGPKPGDLIG